MNSLVSIVIVEDDAVIRTVLEMALQAEGFTKVSSCARGDEGLDEIRRRKPDLVLLDVMLPGMDGFAVCSRIREMSALSATRVIMLTARTQNEDIVRGLECGADDYVTKPFDRKVLLARVKAVLRRGTAIAAGSDFDGLVIDEDAHVARLGGEDLKLPLGEFRILSLLAANRGRVLARSRILDMVQNGDRFSTERTVDVQIANLRRKLGRWAEHIETVRGVGYRVNP
jgi:two-component system phosphate regulon response regulator PhoB